MKPLSLAIAGGIARAVMAYLSGRGVDVGGATADQLADALLIIGPIVWSVVHKIKVDQRIDEARKTGV